MAKIHIANAFSLNMIHPRLWGMVELNMATARVADPVAWLRAREGNGPKAVSIVGHADTARIFSTILGREVEFNRASEPCLVDNLDRVLVGQYVGPRLPEGATELPEGATIEWRVVVIYVPKGEGDV